MSSDRTPIQFLIDLSRETARKSLIDFSHLASIANRGFEPTLPVHGHWMSFILLSGEALRIVFKVHYATADASFFASRAYGIEQNVCSKPRALDFVKEFCNVTAGALKASLENYGLKLGVSLPSTTRGFDEIFFRRNQNAQSDIWIVECDEAKFTCSIDFEILDSALSFNEPTGGAATTESGNLDFL